MPIFSSCPILEGVNRLGPKQPYEAHLLYVLYVGTLVSKYKPNHAMCTCSIGDGFLVSDCLKVGVLFLLYNL